MSLGPGAAVVMAVNDIIEVRFVCTQLDQTAINVRHYKVTATTGTSQTLGDFSDVLDPIFAPLLKALLNTNAAYYGTVVRRVSPIPPSTIAWTNTGAAGGNALGDLLPRQTCGLIGLQTQFAGRAFRGRFYVPFPGEADSDANALPVAGYRGRLANLAFALTGNQLVGIANTATLIPVIYHRASNTTTPINASVIRTKWATQRRRGSYGRPNPPPF